MLPENRYRFKQSINNTKPSSSMVVPSNYWTFQPQAMAALSNLQYSRSFLK